MSYPMDGEKTFKNTDFADPVDVPFGFTAPLRGEPGVHYLSDTCLVAAAMSITGLSNCGGRWRLALPLDIPSLMPGTNQRITDLRILGGSEWVYGTIISAAYSNIVLIDVSGPTDIELFRRDLLPHKTLPDYATTPIDLRGTPSEDVSGVTKLDLVIEQQMSVFSGFAAHHDFGITIAYAWMSDVPPAQGDIEIRVTDAQTGTPLPNIAVRLMRGSIVKASGTTDSQGIVVWSNIDEGNYTGHVYGVVPTTIAGGYEERSEPVTVVAGMLSSYTIPLTPLPATGISIPWYGWVAIGTVGLIAVYYVVKPKLPAITIVR